MITYRKFWELVRKRGITQYELINTHHIPSGTLDKLRNNAVLKTVTIEKICDALDCQPGDLMENLPPEEVVKNEPERFRGGRKAKNGKKE